MTQISLFSGSTASSQSASRHHLAPQFAVSSRIGAAVIAFQEWQERYRSRRDLLRLTDYQLKDIGLSRLDAEEEYSKPFWRG